MGENVTSSWQNRWFGTRPISHSPQSTDCQNWSKPYFQRLFAALFVQPVDFRLWASGVRDRKCWTSIVWPRIPEAPIIIILKISTGGGKCLALCFGGTTLSLVYWRTIFTHWVRSDHWPGAVSRNPRFMLWFPFPSNSINFRICLWEHKLSDLSFWALSFGFLISGIFFWIPCSEHQLQGFLYFASHITAWNLTT